jgi:GGDEF domain-containing protein
MTTSTKNLNAAVKAQAKEIVANGTDIRPRLTSVFTQAAWQSQESGEGLVSLVRAAIDGARQGLDKSVSNDRDDVLRQVVDALGDGLSQTALAGRLAIQEAVTTSRQYTGEDLARLRDDLTAVRELFAETINKGLQTCKALTAGQVATAMTHAGRVAEHLAPKFGAVLDAVRQHPVTLAREGVRAGVAAGQGAAGSLFQTLGRMLQRAGDEMSREGEPDK